jgi:hypothetical protein
MRELFPIPELEFFWIHLDQAEVQKVTHHYLAEWEQAAT